MRYAVTIAMVLVTSVLSSCITVTVPESRGSGDLPSVSNLDVERSLLEGIRAMRNPYVTIIGHPTGRLMGQREAYPLDLEAVCRAAKDTGTALEINSYPKRLDLNDHMARRARELGVMLAVDTDAHSTDQLDQMRFGIGVARRAWVEPEGLLNCLTLPELKRWIAKKRARR